MKNQEMKREDSYNNELDLYGSCMLFQICEPRVICLFLVRKIHPEPTSVANLPLFFCCLRMISPELTSVLIFLYFLYVWCLNSLADEWSRSPLGSEPANLDWPSWAWWTLTAGPKSFLSWLVLIGILSLATKKALTNTVNKIQYLKK